jgi:hypothetical protein
MLWSIQTTIRKSKSMERKEERKSKSKEKGFQTFTILKYEQRKSRKKLPQKCATNIGKLVS